MRSMIDMRRQRGIGGWLCVLGELSMAYSAEQGRIVVLPWGSNGGFSRAIETSKSR